MEKKTYGLIYYSCFALSAAAAAAVIGGAASVGGTALGGIGAGKRQKREMEFNSVEAEKQRDWATSEREAVQEFELDMWNRSNEYNSLSSQLERAKEAGVSPNAILNGGVTTPTANPLTSSVGTGATAATPGSLAPTLANTYSNIGLNAAQTLKTLAEARQTDWQTEFYKKTEEQRIALIDQEFAKNEAQIMDWVASAGLKNANAGSVLESMKYIGRLNEAQLKEMEAKFAVYTNEAKKLESEYDLNKEKIETENAQQAYTGAQTGLVENQAKIAEYQAAQDKLKLDLANQLGISADSPEYQVMLYFAEQNKLDEFIDKTITKPERGKWKPDDYNEETGTSVKLGILGEIGGKRKGRRDVPKSSRNPTIDDVDKQVDYYYNEYGNTD